MPSIVTLTLSPCIDKSASVPSLIPEKKLYCSATKLEPGGGGINVARALKKLGSEATAVFPSGGYTGKLLNHLVEKENISSVIIDTANETRENIIIVDESTNHQYRFGMPANALSESEWKQCANALSEMNDVQFIIVSGSFPPDAPSNFLSLLKKIAEQKNAKLIVDTSGRALKEAASEEVYLIKPNLGELCALAGIERVSVDRVESIARSVIQEYKCSVIAVSLGKDGALLITQDESHRVIPPNVKVKSTVGAGDCMVGGIVYSLANGNSMLQALQYGVACGTAATMNPGTELFHKEDVDVLYSQITRRGS